MVKLIINNTYPLNGGGLASQETETKPLSLNDSFLVDFQGFLPNLYIFRTKDYTRELLCEMTLELKEILVCPEEEDEGHLAPVVACSFPALSLQKLNEKVGFDDYLQRMLMVQFHLKVLEQLLLFCEQQGAVSLILTVKDADSLEIYRRFLIAEDPVNVSGEEQVQVVIPVDGETYDKVADFMDKIDREFRCALWRGQSINSAFREYLKSNACL
jgi:hypothetical protein